MTESSGLTTFLGAAIAPRKITSVSGSGDELTLDTPGTQGLVRVVDAAAAHRVDLVLLVGDTFDHNRVRPDTVARVVETLGRLDVPADLWCYRLDRARAVIGGALSNGGGVYRWLRATLRLPDDEPRIDAALAALPPDEHGLTVLPFWAGERSPHWPLHATATIEGLTTDTTPIAIMQASLEAVTYRLLYVRRRLAQHFPDAAMLVGSGTAVRESAAWAGMIADAFGEPLTVADEDEASSRGAALLALVACGVLRAAGDAPVAVARVLQPRASRTARYAEGYARHWALDATEVGERHTVRGGLV